MLSILSLAKGFLSSSVSMVLLPIAVVAVVSFLGYLMFVAESRGAAVAETARMAAYLEETHQSMDKISESRRFDRENLKEVREELNEANRRVEEFQDRVAQTRELSESSESSPCECNVEVEWPWESS